MKRTNPIARLAAPILAAFLAAAVIAQPRDSTAQRTGGSFGGRSWGNSATAAPRSPPAALRPLPSLRREAPSRPAWLFRRSAPTYPAAPLPARVVVRRASPTPAPAVPSFRRRSIPPSPVVIGGRTSSPTEAEPSSGSEPRYEPVSCGAARGRRGAWLTAALIAAFAVVLRRGKAAARGA